MILADTIFLKAAQFGLHGRLNETFRRLTKRHAPTREESTGDTGLSHLGHYGSNTLIILHQGRQLDPNRTAIAFNEVLHLEKSLLQTTSAENCIIIFNRIESLLTADLTEPRMQVTAHATALHFLLITICNSGDDNVIDKGQLALAVWNAIEHLFVLRRKAAAAPADNDCH
jgi:hypothetical protein